MVILEDSPGRLKALYSKFEQGYIYMILKIRMI